MELIGLVFLYPLGLVVMWLEHKRSKTFSVIIKEYEYHEIRGKGLVLILNLIAGIGFVSIVVILIFFISAMVANSLQGKKF